MNTNNNYLVSYKFYDQKFRRLAIFGLPTHIGNDDETPNINAIAVYVVTCSNKDTFNKSSVREGFNNRDIDPTSKKLTFKINRNSKEMYLDEKLNKMRSRRIIVQENVNPTMHIVICDELTTKKAFMEYCHKHFLVKEELLIGIESTNKMMVISSYGNTITNELFVNQSSLKLRRIPEAMIMKHNEEMQNQEELGKLAIDIHNDLSNKIDPSNN